MADSSTQTSPSFVCLYCAKSELSATAAKRNKSSSSLESESVIIQDTMNDKKNLVGRSKIKALAQATSGRVRRWRWQAPCGMPMRYDRRIRRIRSRVVTTCKTADSMQNPVRQLLYSLSVENYDILASNLTACECVSTYLVGSLKAPIHSQIQSYYV